MTTFEDDFDGWNELSEQEREEIRALVLDLGGVPTDDPDEYE